MLEIFEKKIYYFLLKIANIREIQAQVTFCKTS